ncbi:hypothetical protein PanWU01x14_162630 [Parasponia andersonii]|uniref:Uncharacterized protein n=1 Tax=Parasponia andersonii TaxID=3476 RepID=A0A2P5CD33_PARAD|nr:hypothetical protein PanWU01x14_162630 [Parasponia andersonii]
MPSGRFKPFVEHPLADLKPLALPIPQAPSNCSLLKDCPPDTSSSPFDSTMEVITRVSKSDGQNWVGFFYCQAFWVSVLGEAFHLSRCYYCAILNLRVS